MCGLFGFINYSREKIKNLSELTNSLAEQSAVRGTDATGIAYCKQGNINIIKEAKSAYVFDFKHPDDLVSVTGHTRHSTQGSEKRAYNNHPFYGRVRDIRFALAHNGVLSNDKELRRQYKLPRTKVETDSYIAVQLLESKKELNAESIKFMAEAVDGSFSFSILDDKNNVYLMKEADYIFTWGMKGMKRLMENKFKFTECGVSEDFKSKARSVYFPQESFLEECIIPVDDDIYESSFEISEAFKRFCRQRGLKGNYDIGKFLEEQGIVKTRKRFDVNGRITSEGNPKYVFQGIRLRSKYRVK